MTIAACYVSSEGFVLGTDSTSSVFVGSEGFHYFDHNQKIFEIGVDATVGAITWGLGGLKTHSYRTLFAQLADSHRQKRAPSVAELAQRFADILWPLYTSSYATDISKCRSLAGKPAYDAGKPMPGMRTEAEEGEFAALRQNLFAGFCFGGYILPTRNPSGHVVTCDPLLSQPGISALATNTSFWGAPNMINRLIYGFDSRIKTAIAASPKWQGTPQELDAILSAYLLAHPVLPIRDAIDFVHACIYSTIKALKFSSLSQICGGPIELAVITTDRPFRWVRHKELDGYRRRKRQMTESDSTMKAPTLTMQAQPVGAEPQPVVNKPLDISQLLGDPRECVCVQIASAPSFSLAANTISKSA